MKNMSTIKELDLKMIKIATANNLTVEQFKKLPRKKFIAMCDKFNNK
jgi:hypothetical protein